MAATTTIAEDIRHALDKALPGHFEPANAKIKHGTAHTVIKAVFAALNASTVDITTAASKTAATVTGITLDTGENLPAIGSVLTLRTTGGTAASGPRVVTDAGGTSAANGASAPGVALISDDGTKLTFEGLVTGFVLEYTPRAALVTTTVYTPNS